MALLPDKEKLLRNFLRCANWEENISTLLSWASVCQNYATKTKSTK